MISKRLRWFDSSFIRQAFSLTANIPDAIDLSIGFPDVDTPFVVKKAGIEAIKNGFTKYTPTNGIPELRQAICEKLKNENDIKGTIDEITVTPGVTTAILLSYLATLDAGDELILPDPYFPPYRYLASMLGVQVKFVDLFPDFQLTAEKIKPLISKKTKALIINSPNNPTGAVYQEPELRKIARLVEKNNLLIISDEIYEHFVYGKKHFSIGSIYPYTLTLNGFSKSYFMSGWRIGYVSGPQQLIDAINELQQYIVFSSPSISQKAALKALNNNDVEMLVRNYRDKLDLRRVALSELTDVSKLEGAFFAFIQTPNSLTDIEFAKLALEEKVIVLPGRAFTRRKDYFRITYARELKDLKVAALKLARLLNKG
jgi:aspartate aminotransferase